MKISIYISLVLLCFATFQTSGQPLKKSQVIICGKITTAENQVSDYVLIQISKGIEIFGQRETKVPVDKNGHFKFSTSEITDFATVVLGANTSPYYFMNDIVEAGDSLYIVVDERSKITMVKRTGNNTAKYDCHDLLEQEKGEFLSKRRMNTIDPAAAREDIKTLNLAIDSNYNIFTEKLNRFKSKISKNAYNYYKGTYTYWYYGLWHVLSRSIYLKAEDEDQKSKIKKAFLLYDHQDTTTDKAIASRSPYYLKYLVDQVKLRLYFENNGKGYLYQTIYNELKNSYYGKVKEQALTFFFLNSVSLGYILNYDQKDFTSCLQEAIKLVSSRDLKLMLQKQLLFKKGTTVFDFSMPDTAGRIVSLKDLKGKVVLLDVWATGCSGCALFFDRFKKEVYPQLSGEKNFEMVSINNDRDKKQWIKSINTGKYTSKDHINLFTAGLQMSHPFIKYYDIYAIPFLLLIDKNGKIYSMVTSSLSQDQLLKTIKEALKEI